MANFYRCHISHLDFEGLQRAIDYEITEISSNPNYRSDEPVIKKFRNEHLVPSKLDG